MINIMQKNEIIIEKKKGISNRQLAKQMGVDRKTIAKVWNEYLKLETTLQKATNDVEVRRIQEKMTAAIIDRLAHKSHLIDLSGDSYRAKETREWIQAQ